MEPTLDFDTFISRYAELKNNSVSGRYFSFEELYPQLQSYKHYFEVKEVGRSVLQVPIHTVRAGKGPTKILAWSQMHGNESTTTKAVMDLLSILSRQQHIPEIRDILSTCTFLVIPMLNPDGARRYTRENANKIDLNRDAYKGSQPESRVLRQIFEKFQPDFCFNLHDQRTIFGAGDVAKPATLSFLAPAMNSERTLTPTRSRAMQVITGMEQVLQQYLPSQIGRYDDAYNINCTGDTFQSLKVPTVLFEAGHFPGDYLREETRKFVTLSLFTALQKIATNDLPPFDPKDYFGIPENKKIFYDVILRNAKNFGKEVDIAIQFQERLNEGTIRFEPVVQQVSRALQEYGHREILCAGQEVTLTSGKSINENDIVTEILLNDNKLSIKTQDIP